jgi:hypothetical protein
MKHARVTGGSLYELIGFLGGSDAARRSERLRDLDTI